MEEQKELRPQNLNEHLVFPSNEGSNFNATRTMIDLQLSRIYSPVLNWVNVATFKRRTESTRQFFLVFIKTKIINLIILVKKLQFTILLAEVRTHRLRASF